MTLTAPIAALTDAAHELDYYTTNTGCTPIHPQWTLNAAGHYEIPVKLYTQPYTYTLQDIADMQEQIWRNR